MTNVPEPIRDQGADISGKPPDLAELARDYRRTNSAGLIANAAYFDSQDATSEREEEMEQAGRDNKAATNRLIQAMIEAGGVSVPDGDRWYELESPFTSFQADGYTVALIAKDGENAPKTIAEMIDRVRVVTFESGHEVIKADFPSVPNVQDEHLRQFSVITRDNLLYHSGRIGETLDDVIREEVVDFQSGLTYHLADGGSSASYAKQEGDRAIWSGGQIMGVIRARPEGTAEVVRFDAPAPLPMTPQPDVPTIDLGRPGATAADGKPLPRVDGREPNPWDQGRIVTEAIILAYENVRKQVERAKRLEFHESDIWLNLIHRFARSIQESLTETILAWNPETKSMDVFDLLCVAQPARAIRYGGRVYVASPGPDYQISDQVHDRQVMTLNVIADGGVVDLG